MDSAEIQAQRETDEEILHYVRGMQEAAPVNTDAICRYLVRTRRRKIAASSVADRLADLVDRNLLKKERTFEPGLGFENFYQVTALARRILDGAAPWDWEL